MQHTGDLVRFRGVLKEIAIGVTLALYQLLPTIEDGEQDDEQAVVSVPTHIARQVVSLLQNDRFLHRFEVDEQGVSKNLH